MVVEEVPSNARVGAPDPPRKAARKVTGGISKTCIIKCQPESSFLEDHYDVVRFLGAGGFGTISLVRERSVGALRVCKQVDTSDMERNVLELMEREIALLSTLDHPYIVKLFEFAIDPSRDELLLILEYVDQGDAQALRKKSGGQLPERVAARLIHQVLVALAYCHARGIIHRDVKPENMMLTRGDDENSFDCKLIDFGVASLQAINSEDVAGSPPYMAPEVVSRRGCHTLSDIFSLGATTMELLTGKLPFGTVKDHGGRPGALMAVIDVYSQQGFQLIEKKLRQSNWSNLSSLARDFTGKLLHPRIHDRPSAVQAVGDSWLQLHRAHYDGLTDDMVTSMVSYSQAPDVLRCCLLIVAARTNHDAHDRFSAPFLSIDQDGDGVIGLFELQLALKGFYESGKLPMSAAELFDAMDLAHRGRVSFTEFVAACLIASYPSTEELMRAAFEALDTDRDGLVSFQHDIIPYFNDSSIQGPLKQLPRDRLFDDDDWHRCLKDLQPTDSSSNRSSTSARRKPKKRSQVPRVAMKAGNSLLRFLACRGNNPVGDDW